MKRLISCEFNMDTNRVELLYTNGTMLAINTIAVENEYAEDMYQRSEMDWLIYNDPLAYADLVLNGDVEGYLKRVTQYDNACIESFHSLIKREGSAASGSKTALTLTDLCSSTSKLFTTPFESTATAAICRPISSKSSRRTSPEDAARPLRLPRLSSPFPFSCGFCSF